MTTFATPGEVMAYFGITDPEELEAIIVEHDLDALVDDEGRLLGVQGHRGDMAEALFQRHEREVGHRPDDEEAHAAAVALHHAMQAEMKAQRKVRRQQHVDKRVQARKGTPVGHT